VKDGTGPGRDEILPAIKPTGSPGAEDVGRAAGGDAAAFERLYRQYVPMVHALARRMASPDDADELTQDVFVRVWEKLGTFRGEAAFATWLHRVAVNVILGHRKTAAIRRERFLDDDAEVETAAVGPRPIGHAIDVAAALARLPEGARKVFVLHDVEGFRHEEIADLLGVTAGTSKSQLHRARMLLRARLTA
jgi:RNA polymerase sigma-70 factor, ECF subfamily